MADPFLGQVTITAFSYAAQNWAKCDGQSMPISQNQALFSLLGTIYGGDGRTTFALPDLRGRAPVHASPELPQGTAFGAEKVTLTPQQMPAHTHALNASPDFAASSSPFGGLPAARSRGGPLLYSAPAGSLVPMNPQSVGSAGSSQGHGNMQPYATVSYMVSLVGIFPSRN